jgi:outer membrane protein OmpA-like peptidoglycan-associated protein
VQRQRGDNENREGLSNRGGARPSASLKRTKSGVQKRSWFDASPSQEHIASIYFPTDSFSLDGNDIQVLKKIRDDIETKLLGHDVTVEILGFADERGSRRHNKELSQARADAVKITLDSLLPSASHRSNNLKIPDPEGRGEAEKPQEGTTAEELSEYRRVDIKVSPPTPAQPEVVPAPSCSCDGGWPYSNVAIAFVTDIAPMIKKLASSSPAPAYAVAGAIADEHEAQQRYFGLLDAVQNRALDWGLVPSGEPEYEEGTGEEKEKESEGGRIEKFANALENDIGPANIKVRTAVRHAMERRIGTTAKPPSDVDVGHIVDQLLTVRGTVQTAVWVIEKAHTLFGPYIKNYPQPLAEAVYVSYFKQGKREYYEDFQEKLDFDPSHRPCPGTAGCRYKENREQITKALGAE